MPITYGSVCSGIEGASVAWAPLGWRCAFMAEIEPFPRAVLKHHYPDVPLYSDFTHLRDRHRDILADADVLVGGTPCQGFSVAGLRGSLTDDRSNLCLEFIRLADTIDDLRRAAGRPPCWVVWENVPGIFSTEDNAFGAFLAGLVGSDAALNAGARGRWTDAGVVAGPSRVAAWRTLDAQHFGLAQRRRRVFVVAVGGAGAWRCADALLPLADSLSGYPAPRREARERAAPTISARTTAGGGLGTDFDCDGGLIAFGGNRQAGEIDLATAVNAHGGPHGRLDFETETLLVDQDPGAVFAIQGAAGRANPASGPDGVGVRDDDMAYTLEARAEVQAVAFALRGRADGAQAEAHGNQAGALRSASGGSSRDYVAFTANGRDEVRLQGGDGEITGVLSPAPQWRRGDTTLLAFSQNTRDEVRLQGEGDISGALNAEEGTHQRTYVAFDAAQLTHPENRSNPQPGDPAPTLADTGQPMIAEVTPLDRWNLTAEGDTSGTISTAVATAGGHAVITPFDPRQLGSPGNWSEPQPGDPSHPLRAVANAQPAVAFNITPSQGNIDFNARPTERVQALTGNGNRVSARGGDLVMGITLHGSQAGTTSTASETDVASSMRARSPGQFENSATTAALHGSMVRRLTPLECCRLQGFPDTYLDIQFRGKPAADGPKYKALGNSFATPVIRWLGERIAAVMP